MPILYVLWVAEIKYVCMYVCIEQRKEDLDLAAALPGEFNIINEDDDDAMDLVDLEEDNPPPPPQAPN